MPFIIKRILFYPKKSVMEIGSPSAYRPYIHESGIPDSEVILFTENKARELVAGGTTITKEMLDAMEFSSSSSEEFTEDNQELIEGKKAVSENIDKIVADEFKANLHSDEGESTEENSDEFNRETSGDMEKQLSERLEGVVKIDDGAKTEEDVSSVDNAAEQGESVAAPVAIDDQVDKEQEKPVQPPDAEPAQVESLAEIEDASVTLDIPQDKAAEHIYVYQPAAFESLPAKVLLEQVKTNFNVCFLDLHDDIVTLNDNFKKEFYNKFMKILEDEIAQKDLSDKYIKSLTDVRKSLMSKYENVVRKDVDVRYTVDEILAIKERTEIPINVDKTIFAAAARRERREDSISLFRLELNRIAWTNSNSTIERIKRLKVKKDTEIKKMAEVLFDKAISEEAFCKLYAFVVQNLYKTFRSDEEKRRGDTKSVFFSTLIKLCQNILHNKEKWTTTHDLSTLSMEERISMEETLEKENIEKEIKKGRMLGTVKFISLLYSYTIIGFKGISLCISSLLDLDDEQNVETLCALLGSCGEKMVQSGKHVELINVMNMLKQKRQWSNRIRFMVCDILEKCDGWVKEKRKDSPFKNSFSALKNDRGFLMNKENVEIARKENEMVVEHITAPPKDATPVASNSEGRESRLLDMMDVMARIIEDVPHVNDYTSLINEMKERTKEADLSLILESYFLIIIEIYESYGDYLKLLKLYLADVKADERVVNESIVSVENKLGDISVDCPYAKSNFHFLSYCLGRWMNCQIKVSGYDEGEMEKKYEGLAFN
ncbi:hypothetical protein VCUG_01643 [Vavraia culicis subsp. floridensis]|uniref:MIF4G domain-containing protein n=1 Tax=Vavraia culicis (isolate floridensis) TaxID=948595 RepID=L2GTE0_VAVCU|nr:uncharacterized protein VCUG_01643 [Vavraia culicis subsp. floridensis]ELA46869.1 hypothetical protein VCUG_01643 [Vavraia culicis subsp. floridensis]